MVARLFDGCGVLPSGIMTSHSTRAPLMRVLSGKTRTGLRTQSELLPSACLVELPSKPQRGSCSSVGKPSYSLICVLPRRFGTGVYPSSHKYSSLYFVIPRLSSVEAAKTEEPRRIPGHRRPAPALARGMPNGPGGSGFVASLAGTGADSGRFLPFGSRDSPAGRAPPRRLTCGQACPFEERA